jgi:LysM repeat protein
MVFEGKSVPRTSLLMRRLFSLLLLAAPMLACNMTTNLTDPAQLPTLAVTPGPDFIAPTAAPTDAAVAALPTEPTAASMTGEQPSSMVAPLPTQRAGSSAGGNSRPTETDPTPPDCQVNTEWTAVYTVVSGDRLSLIADRYQLTTAQLATANCIDNPDRIRVGQVLIVPDGVVTPPAPSPIPLNTPDADGFTTYRNTDYGFSLRYPPGWNRLEPGSYVNLVSPDGASVFEILLGEAGTSPQAQAEACQAGRGCPRGADLTVTPTELAGQAAYRIDLSGAGSLRVILFLTLNGRDLAIRGFGDVAAFEQVLASFAVG